MPWSIEYHDAGRIIEVVYSGMVRVVDLESSINATLAMADEKSTARMLVDVSAMQGGHTMMDLYAKMESAAPHPFVEPLREALILAPKAPPNVLENVEFWAAGLRLRGIDVQIFVERDSAVKWLCRA